MEDKSADYTAERKQAAKEHLAESQELAKQQFVFLGEPEPEVEIPAPEDRSTEGFTDKEKAAYERQTEIASDSYSPKSFGDFKSEIFEAEDINPDAKEFQLREPDEFTGPEAGAKASAEGVNPRSVATSSDPEGLAQPSDQMAPVSENAEPVTEADEPSPETPDVLDD